MRGRLGRGGAWIFNNRISFVVREELVEGFKVEGLGG